MEETINRIEFIKNDLFQLKKEYMNKDINENFDEKQKYEVFKNEAFEIENTFTINKDINNYNDNYINDENKVYETEGEFENNFFLKKGESITEKKIYNTNFSMDELKDIIKIKTQGLKYKNIDLSNGSKKKDIKVSKEDETSFIKEDEKKVNFLNELLSFQKKKKKTKENFEIIS